MTDKAALIPPVPFKPGAVVLIGKAPEPWSVMRDVDLTVPAAGGGYLRFLWLTIGAQDKKPRTGRQRRRARKKALRRARRAGTIGPFNKLTTVPWPATDHPHVAGAPRPATPD